MPQATPPLTQPRYPLVRKFPVTTLAPYVGLSSEALAWCAGNRVHTVAEAMRTLRPQGRSKLIKCPIPLRGELKRLIDPPGIPADWPLHPDTDRRFEQQLVHVPSIASAIRSATWEAKDRWLGMLYLIYCEEDFMQYTGIGRTKLPMVLAWRDDMRKRHERPSGILKADVLTGREWNHRVPLASMGPVPFAPLWEAAAEQAATGYIGSVRYAGCAKNGTNHVCLRTADRTYTLRWPDWAFGLAKDALQSGHKLFVMARGEPNAANLLEVHLLSAVH